MIKTGEETGLMKNAFVLKLELEWLEQVLETRFKMYFGQENTLGDIYQINPPSIEDTESIYSRIISHYNMGFAERVIVLLALTPHVCPQLLDRFFVRNEQYGRGFTEFGGIKGQYHSGFLPTGETVAFVLASNDLGRRFQIQELFNQDHYFYKQNIIRLEKERSNEPELSGILTISKEFLTYFTAGTEYQPRFSTEFPAKRIYTKMNWEDLVLEDQTEHEVQEIRVWLKHHSRIMADETLGKIIKPGYRSLFYGPPGTGKTLTASLLGKTTEKDVYRVDLSKVVSKYIGETEKNLANIFDQAENKDWILFFDEADALFGKRSNTNDAKDRHANQEVAYLLQRVEDFPGLVILASNLKTNIDEAFIRRFQTMIYFPMPSVEMRMKLWRRAFSGTFKPSTEIDLEEIAEEYEVSGGAMNNILLHCSLRALEAGNEVIQKHDLIEGIKREFRKEGKTL